MSTTTSRRRLLRASAWFATLALAAGMAISSPHDSGVTDHRPAARSEAQR
jgi:hypothetical protein